MDKWEYIVTTYEGSKLNKGLDDWGRQGWELIFCNETETMVDDVPYYDYSLIFKRPAVDKINDGPE